MVYIYVDSFNRGLGEIRKSTWVYVGFGVSWLLSVGLTRFVGQGFRGLLFR